MTKESLYIRRFTKVLNENMNGRMEYWWFDMEKYIRLAAKYDYEPKRLQAAIQCATPDEEAPVISEKTIGRVLGYINGEREGKGEKSVTIDTIKSLSRALCDGDEYGLLIKIEPYNTKMIINEASEIWPTDDLSYIYRMMNGVLYELEISSYYSYKPGTDEDGFDYYDMCLQNIRKEIDSRFWMQKNMRDKLYLLAEELEIFVKSYSHPGVPDRWQNAYPALRFYDCVFDFMEENPQLYEQIRQGRSSSGEELRIGFKFYPTEEDCRERTKYFSRLSQVGTMQNRQYSYERHYQNAVVEAFQTVFKAEFS